MTPDPCTITTPTAPRRRVPARWRRGGIAALACMILIGALAGCGVPRKHITPMTPRHGDQQTITKANLGYMWPFNVTHGTIACHTTPAGSVALFTAPDGRTYALNQLASQDGYPSAHPIRNGFSLGGVLDHALKLCQPQ